MATRRNEYTLSKRIIVALTLGIVCLGCGDRPAEHPMSNRETASRKMLGAETYNVTGRIMSVTPDRDFIMVRHDTIEGFMDAMTMPFHVVDTAIVSGVVAGDSVGFVIEVAGGEAVITSLERY